MASNQTRCHSTLAYTVSERNTVCFSVCNLNCVRPQLTLSHTRSAAWSRAHKFHANAAQRAADLLNLQLELSTPHMLGDGAKPDFQSFTTCIMAQADSVSPDKVQHARSLLDSLLARVTSGDLQVTRNPTAPFSAVLSVIAKSTPSKGPLDVSIIATDELDGFTSVVDTDADPYSIAKMLYENVESDFHGIGTSADLHAASAFLRCIVAHTTPESTERVNTARRVFENACQAGQVSRSVIQAFKDALGGRAAGFHGLHSKNPPKFWSSSVPAAFR